MASEPITFYECLLTQAHRHPSMEVQDAVKLCYQAAFGAEHILSDPAAARDHLYKEFSSVKADANARLAELISPDTCRINLAAWKARKLPKKWLFNLFCASAHPNSGGELAPYFTDVGTAAARGLLSFSKADWEDWVEKYLASGAAPVHHSAAYRTAERPAYRIVSARFIPLLPILEKMALGARVVAIDGRCAGGKSTTGALLAQATGAGLIHMDDFCSPAGMMQVERLGMPGGNINYALFSEDVLPYLSKEKAFSYRCFDCSKMMLKGKRRVARSPYRVVEGSYSQHPYFGDYMDLRVFVDIDPETQAKRILLRDGEALAKAFERLWIPQEERYFSALSIREKADIVIRV